MKPLPPGLAAQPSLDRWLRLTNDAGVIAFTGKVEIGQGILTALRTIVAEELDVAPERVEVVSAHTGRTPNEGVTAGSMSIETSGAALRQASAWLRRLLLLDASARLGVAVDQLTASDGEIAAPGVNERLDYWQLAPESFDFEIRARAPEKAPGEYRLVGRSSQRRMDIPAKATVAAFVHDQTPGLHARLVRPPSIHHRLVELDIEIAEPGRLVVDGSFVAVAHPREFDAVQLADRVASKARWHRPGTPVPHFEIDQARRDSAQAFPIRDGAPRRTPPRRITTSHKSSYSRPFLMHGSLGPSAATATWRDGTLTMESASQESNRCDTSSPASWAWTAPRWRFGTWPVPAATVTTAPTMPPWTPR